MKKEIDTNKFKVGERVEARWFGEWLKGTVAEHDPSRDILDYCVLLDTIGKHYFSGRSMRYIKNTKQNAKIVITTDFTTTTATHYDGNQKVKTATAKCAPDDKFNFTTGAQLAFNRLVYGTDYNPAEVALKQKEEKPQPTDYLNDGAIILEALREYAERQDPKPLTKSQVGDRIHQHKPIYIKSLSPEYNSVWKIPDGMDKDKAINPRLYFCDDSWIPLIAGGKDYEIYDFEPRKDETKCQSF